MSKGADTEPAKWLLLIHQLPPKPAYFRVKVWRRLQSLGAVAIKGSVYALPATEETLEDFQWLLQEIAEGGAEGSICEARFIDGLNEQQIEAMFNAARDQDYEEIANAARDLAAELTNGRDDNQDERRDLGTRSSRLRKRLTEVTAIDFFGANSRETAEGLLSELEARLKEASDIGASEEESGVSEHTIDKLSGRPWVTRRGVHVDRIASAWLIKRFIDPEASFKFAPPRGYVPAPGELRFDMFDAEFTHEGDKCTFEVLLARSGHNEAALNAVAEIIHDIDLKDGKFGREETTGIASLIAGIAIAHKDDHERLSRGAVVFNDLYEYFRKKRR